MIVDPVSILRTVYLALVISQINVNRNTRLELNISSSDVIIALLAKKFNVVTRPVTVSQMRH